VIGGGSWCLVLFPGPETKGGQGWPHAAGDARIHAAADQVAPLWDANHRLWSKALFQAATSLPPKAATRFEQL